MGVAYAVPAVVLTLSVPVSKGRSTRARCRSMTILATLRAVSRENINQLKQAPFACGSVRSEHLHFCHGSIPSKRYFMLDTSTYDTLFFNANHQLRVDPN